MQPALGWQGPQRAWWARVRQAEWGDPPPSPGLGSPWDVSAPAVTPLTWPLLDTVPRAGGTPYSRKNPTSVPSGSPHPRPHYPVVGGPRLEEGPGSVPAPLGGAATLRPPGWSPGTAGLAPPSPSLVSRGRCRRKQHILQSCDHCPGAARAQGTQPSEDAAPALQTAAQSAPSADCPRPGHTGSPAGGWGLGFWAS